MPGPALDRHRPGDAQAIAAALSDWQTTRWLSAVPYPYGLDDAHTFIATAGPDEHAIRLDGRLVGTVGLQGGFGIWIAPDCQGRGIARRAAVLALTRFFATGAPSAEARYLDGNDRSARLLEWLGFVPGARRAVASRALGRSVPAREMLLTRAAFEARHAIAIDTPRLHLGAITDQDLPALHRIVTRPEVARMLLRFAPGMAPDETAAILRDGALLPPLRLAVRMEGRTIGAVALGAGSPPQLSYFLDPAMAGQGIGRDMVAAAFGELIARLDPPAVGALVFLDNPASQRILRDLGFRYVEDVAIRSRGRADVQPAARYLWRGPDLSP